MLFHAAKAWLALCVPCYFCTRVGAAAVLICECAALPVGTGLGTVSDIASFLLTAKGQHLATAQLHPRAQGPAGAAVEKEFRRKQSDPAIIFIWRYIGNAGWSSPGPTNVMIGALRSTRLALVSSKWLQRPHSWLAQLQHRRQPQPRHMSTMTAAQLDAKKLLWEAAYSTEPLPIVKAGDLVLRQAGLAPVPACASWLPHRGASWLQPLHAHPAHTLLQALLQAAQEVPQELLGTEELLRLVELMVEAMRAAPGVGLAAPQIGVPLQVGVRWFGPVL